MEILYFFLQFVIGGMVIVGITLLAKFVNPRYSGIVYAFPAILILSMIFIYLNAGVEVACKTLKSILIYEFTLVFFIVVFYLLFYIYRYKFWWALGISLIMWIIAAFFVQRLIKS